MYLLLLRLLGWPENERRLSATDGDALDRQNTTGDTTTRPHFVPKHAARDALLSTPSLRQEDTMLHQACRDTLTRQTWAQLNNHPNLLLSRRSIASVSKPRSVFASTLPSLPSLPETDQFCAETGQKGKERVQSREGSGGCNQENDDVMVKDVRPIDDEHPREYFSHEHIPKRARKRLNRHAAGQTAQARLPNTPCSSASQSNQSLSGSSIAGQHETSSAASTVTSCTELRDEQRTRCNDNE